MGLIKRYFWGVAVCTMLVISASAQAREAKIVIAVQPTATAEELSSQAKELEAYLEQMIGQEVEVLFPTSYAGVVEALRYGHAQVAFMGAWPALLAQEKAGAHIALAEVREVMIDGDKVPATHYYSYWVVRKDSPYRSLEELRNQKVAFPSQLSTSGYVAPMSTLVRRGLVARHEGAPVDPKEFFAEVRFAGGYAQAWESLKSSQVEASVIAGDVAEKLYREVLEATRIIEQQGPVPSHVVVTSSSFSGPARERLVQALKSLGGEEHRPMMRKFISGIFLGFEDASEDHLAPLKAMLQEVGSEWQEKSPKK